MTKEMLDALAAMIEFDQMFEVARSEEMSSEDDSSLLLEALRG